MSEQTEEQKAKRNMAINDYSKNVQSKTTAYKDNQSILRYKYNQNLADAAYKYDTTTSEATKTYNNAINKLNNDYNLSISDFSKAISSAQDKYNTTLEGAKTTYQNSIDKAGEAYLNGMNTAVMNHNAEADKYTGENGYRGALQLGQQGAANTAAGVASIVSGNAKTNGANTPMAKAVGSDSIINAYIQGLSDQQQAARNSYADRMNAANTELSAESQKYGKVYDTSVGAAKDILNTSVTGAGNNLSTDVTGAQGKLNAAGNRYSTGVGTAGNTYNTTMGAAGSQYGANVNAASSAYNTDSAANNTSYSTGVNSATTNVQQQMAKLDQDWNNQNFFGKAFSDERLKTDIEKVKSDYEKAGDTVSKKNRKYSDLVIKEKE